jgi:hypothetical protein
MENPMTTPKKRRRFRFTLRTLLASVGLDGYILVLMLAMFAGCDPIPKRVREPVENPGEYFEEVTGIPWPTDATVVSADDSHTSFHPDGIVCIVADVPNETLMQWLDKKPPWAAGNWKQGPVPSEIAIPSHMEQLLSCETVWYAARERSTGSPRWHNGDLIAFDPQLGRLLLTVWDY